MDALSLKKPRAGQIRPPVEQAIQLIVARGLTILEAAESVGMKGPSLAKALRRGHISDRLTHVRREWMESKTLRAWVTVAELAEDAASEDTRLRAARTILEAAGELNPNRHTDAPRVASLVQIILQGSDAPAVTVQGTHAGVFEAPAYMPSALPAPADNEAD